MSYKAYIYKQQGAVLMVGLMILLVLTIIGIASISFTVLGEKLTSNQRDKSISFQAAESALADGETWVRAQTKIPAAVDSCQNAPCELFKANTFSNYQDYSQSWWQTNATSYSSTIHVASTQPNYVIEEHSFIPYDLSSEARSKGLGLYYYKVTANGTGSTNSARSMVQSIFATQFN